MVTVSEVTLKYSALGAAEAARADARVAQSVQRTARIAQREEGTISRWLQRHRRAIMLIGGAVLGVLAGIIAASPSLSAHMGGIRMAFSLIAMTIGDELVPALEWLETKLFGLADSLEESPRWFRGVLAWGTLALAGVSGVLVALALLEKAFKGTRVAAWVGGVAARLASLGPLAVGALAIVAGAIVGLGVVWGIEHAGILRMIEEFGVAVGAKMPAWARDGFTSLILNSMGHLVLLGALVVGFVRGGWRGAWQEATRLLEVFGGAWGRTWQRASAGVSTWASDTLASIRAWAAQKLAAIHAWAQATGARFEKWRADTARVFNDLVASAFRWGADLVSRFLSGIDSRWQALQSRLSSIRAAISRALSFDIPQNDRMAERWGRDLVTHFARGMEGAERRLAMAMPSVGAPLPTASGTGGTVDRSVHVTIERGAIVLSGADTRGGNVDVDRLANAVARKLGNHFGGR